MNTINLMGALGAAMVGGSAGALIAILMFAWERPKKTRTRRG